jgi:cytoskeletal protein CcmA (bactofilin family)
MTEAMPRASDLLAANQNHTLLGRSVVLRGDLSGKEDLLIEGHFEGTLNLQEHCVTVGPHGQLKGEIHARQVVIQGAVSGNISAREKIEIRKTGEVVGDLVAAGIAIEDGAYFKGSIDILREQTQEASRSFPTANALKASA